VGCVSADSIPSPPALLTADAAQRSLPIAYQLGPQGLLSAKASGKGTCERGKKCSVARVTELRGVISLK
jgi:hypothetical protein